MSLPAPIRVALRVAELLEAHGVRYLIGGSLASSFASEPRSTLDVDMVVELEESIVDSLVSQLENEFYVDGHALRRAIAERSSANLIHLESSIKVDLFIAGGTPIDAEQMNRRRVIELEGGQRLFTYQPEDILLQKLRWYALTDRSSDRQWRDILAIVSVNRGSLDRAYLRSAAAKIELTELLDRILDEPSR